MFVVFVIVAAAVLFSVVVLALGRGGAMEADDARRPVPVLPDGPVRAADLDGVRFTVAARGYRMDEVDELLERLADELDERDRRIAELRAEAVEESAHGTRQAGAGTGLPQRRPGESRMP